MPTTAQVRRRRLGAIGSLAGIIALVTLLLASAGGDADQPTNLSTSASPPPPLACPLRGQAVTTSATGTGSPTTGNSSHNITWAAVFERVFVTDSMDGSVKKAPHQFTHVATAGNGPATIDVPMSSSHLRRRSRGKKPDVVNGVAQIKVNPTGSAIDRLDSDYERPLPVSVKVTYKLNGQPISSGDVKGKSGTVETDYQLTNTTPKSVKVCFVGFNDKLVKKTVTAPSPMLAYLSFDVPKNVAEFTAPKASIDATISGVGVSWTVGLFKPLGSTTQTLAFTMHTPKAKIPKATLLIETLLPSSLTGQVPAESAAIVGQAQAALGKVQNDVAALELKASGSHHSSGGGRSAGRAGSGRSGSDAPRAKSGSAGTTRSSFSSPTLSFGTSPAVLSQMQSQIATLGQASLTFTDNAGARTNVLAASTTRSIAGLTTSTNQLIDSLTASTNRSIDIETDSMRNSTDILATTLRRSVDRRSLDRLTTNATRLQSAATVVANHASALSARVARLTTRVNDLVAGLQPPVQNALGVYLALGRIRRDLDAVSVVHKSGAAYLKLVADLTTTETLAQTVSTSLNRLETEARTLAGGVQNLQTDVISLQQKITALVVASIANADSTAQTAMTNAVSGLSTRYTAAVASLNQAVSGIGANGHGGVASAEAAAHRKVTAAESQANSALRSALASAKATVASAELTVTDVLTSVKAKAHADLVAAEHKAKQGGQAALAAAQASAAEATAKTERALTTANDDYAQLLAVHQQAVANELPGGDATGVNVENGSLVYTIDGT